MHSYKKCLEFLVQEAARNYLMALAPDLLIMASGDDARPVFSTDPEQLDADGYTWHCKLPVRKANILTTYVTVGGTVDDQFGILCSCISNAAGNIIWIDSETARQAFGITEFKLF